MIVANNSERVSLTKEELVKLRDLQGVAWGRYTKAYRKLDHAIQKIEEREANGD